MAALTMTLLLAALASASIADDADPALRDLMRGAPGAEARAELALTDRATTADARSRILSILCHVRGMRGRYAEAARSCAAQPAPTRSPDSIAFWSALADIPPPRAIGSATVPITRNWAQLSQVVAEANGARMEWAVDTGAEVSIMAASLARKIGVKPLTGNSLRVGTATASTSGELGLIGLLRIGDATVENLVVLVLADERFALGKGRILPPILGLPNLVAFGRVAWLDGGTRMALGDAAPPAGPDAAPLYWHEDGIGLEFVTPAGERIAHFDSGANRGDIHPEALALLAAAERTAIASRMATTGGAGGLVRKVQGHVPRIAARIAGVPITLTDISVEDSMESGVRIGMDFVDQLETLVLDFEAMRVAAKLKPVPQAAQR